MKKTLLFCIIAVTTVMLSVFVSCKQERVYSVDELYKVASTMVDDTITLEGLCTHLCSHGGKKAFLRGESEKQVLRVNSGKNFERFEPECINNILRVKGVVREFSVPAIVSDTTKNDEGEHGCETEKKASRKYFIEGISYKIVKKR